MTLDEKKEDLKKKCTSAVRYAITAEASTHVWRSLHWGLWCDLHNHTWFPMCVKLANDTGQIILTEVR